MQILHVELDTDKLCSGTALNLRGNGEFNHRVSPLSSHDYEVLVKIGVIAALSINTVCQYDGITCSRYITYGMAQISSPIRGDVYYRCIRYYCYQHCSEEREDFSHND